MERNTQEIELDGGWTINDRECRRVRLKELTVGDVLDATREAERIVHTENGPQLVASPMEVSLRILAKQVSIIDGAQEVPCNLSLLRKLRPADLERLQNAAETADALPAEVGQRGRPDAPQAGA